MSTPRIIWLIICSFWAFFWITFGWAFLPILNLPLAAASALAMIPAFIGRTRTAPAPVMYQQYWHGQPQQQRALTQYPQQYSHHG